MRWVLTAALVGLLGAPAQLHAGSSLEGGCLPRRYVAEVVRVVDGDTIVARILIPEWSITTVERLRLLGVDAPELKASSASERKRARMARDLVKSLIGASRRIFVEVPGCRRGFYGRPLVNVITMDGRDIASEIKKAGMGKGR